MSELLTEPEAWREIARRIDSDSFVGLFGAIGNMPFDVIARMDARLRVYDNPAWHYGSDDDYANMRAPDRVIAALFLAAEAEADE